jgi:hypothetical protein
MIDHGSRSTWGPGPSRSRLRAQKYDPPPLKQTFPTTFVLWNFCLVSQLKLLIFSWPCLGPPDPWFRVNARSRRSRPDQVGYWEGVLHILFIKICLKMIEMIDHGSRSTWGPGSSRSRLRAKNMIPPPKTDLPHNFCFIKFLPSITVETVDFLQTLFRAPEPLFRVKALPGIKCKHVHGQLFLKGLLAQPTTPHTLLCCSCTWQW